MESRILTKNEKTELKAIADGLVTLRNSLRPSGSSGLTDVNKFLSQIYEIHQQNWIGFGSYTRAIKNADRIHKITAISCSGYLEKIEKLHSDISEVTQSSRDTLVAGFDPKIVKKFREAAEARDAIADSATELIRCLRQHITDTPPPPAPPVMAPSPASDAGSQLVKPESALIPLVDPGVSPTASVFTGHHSASELANFVLDGFPGNNRHKDGCAPLLVTLDFNSVEVRDHGIFELRANSTKLSVDISTGTTNLEADRIVPTDYAANLRVKRTSSNIDKHKLRWLIEDPAPSKELEGTFSRVEICNVSDVSKAEVSACMTITAGEIAVWHDGVKIGGGADNGSQAERVVRHWAIWAGLGEPPGEDPFYQIGSHNIAALDND